MHHQNVFNCMLYLVYPDYKEFHLVHVVALLVELAFSVLSFD